jgi:predicted transposase YbfD/YdcC
VVTIDAMGTQVKIAEKIVKKKAEYVLAVKENQENLHRDFLDYFNENDFKKNIESGGNYKKTIEKSHGQIEIREYYQTDDIKWLTNKSRWKGLKSIGIIEKNYKEE